MNLKYSYEINQVEANFYGSLYVACRTPQEKFKDTKGVIRGHQSNKTMAKVKDQKTNNNLQNTSQKN